MAKRRKAELHEIANLWSHYFREETVSTARALARGVRAAVVMSDSQVMNFLNDSLGSFWWQWKVNPPD